MNITQEQLQKILVGNYAFTQLGFSMLITRLKNVYKENPSPNTLSNCVREVNAFLGKYSGIMGPDCAFIAKL